MQDDKKLPGSAVDRSVVDFLRLWNLKDPQYLEFHELDKRYEADFCHVSAKHAAQHHGGRRVHGWSLWEYDNPTGGPSVIVGDFHSIWETPGGELKDVTPPKLGTRTLFVRDASLVIKMDGAAQLLYNNRTNVAQAPRIHQGMPIQEDCFRMPSDRGDLVAYCRKLGLPDTSMM